MNKMFPKALCFYCTVYKILHCVEYEKCLYEEYRYFKSNINTHPFETCNTFHTRISYSLTYIIYF